MSGLIEGPKVICSQRAGVGHIPVEVMRVDHREQQKLLYGEEWENGAKAHRPRAGEEEGGAPVLCFLVQSPVAR